MDIDVTRIEIDHTSKQLTQGPLLRVVVDGSGCGIPECGCSGDNYICISDGDMLLTTRLTDEQAEEIRAGRLETA